MGERAKARRINRREAAKRLESLARMVRTQLSWIHGTSNGESIDRAWGLEMELRAVASRLRLPLKREFPEARR